MEKAAHSATRDPLIGSVLDERYRVLRRIGRGGMGIVYLAQHVLIGRKYAIKTLSERTNATEEMVARFHREAVAAAAVGSQHVVDVTDMGRLLDGTLYIALEYLDGAELASVVHNEGPFAVARAVKVACQLCDALSAVHEKGIVHRDLKPENLFLIEKRGVKDFVKVLDFGICKLLEGAEPSADPDQPALTRTNASLGTPQYMAPEQFQTSAKVDQRADIHAVGAILYFMLTGRPPFDGTSVPQLYMRVCVEPPPLLLPQRPDMPPELEDVIRRAMQKHPEDRYATSAELKRALSPFLGSLAEPALQSSGQVTARELPALSTPTEAVLRPPTTVDLVVSQRHSVEQFTPRLPERRWRRPALAVSLVVGAICSMGFGAWALTSREPAPVALQARAPRADRERSSAPAMVIAPEPAAASEQPTIAKTAAQAPRPKVRSRAPEVAASAPAPSEPAAAPESASSEPVQPSPATVEDAYHIPRRALKSVF